MNLRKGEVLLKESPQRPDNVMPNRQWWAAVAAVAAILLLGALCHAEESPLPPIEDVLGDRDTLATEMIVFVQTFRFEGNSAFSDEELLEVVKDYVGREVTSEELHEARQVLTVHYVESGYINSGAVLPDQKVEDGVIRFQIVEGELSRIEVSGNKQTRTAYIKQRVRLGIDSPLDIWRLKNNLDIIRQNAIFARLEAKLQPGAKPGESWLDLTVEEKQPFHAALEFGNPRNPSVGAERFSLLVGHRNVMGMGDSLNSRYGLINNGLKDAKWAGVDDASVSYALPITAHDTTLALGYIRSDVLLVEEPFEDLEIASESETFSLGLRHPFYRTPNSELALSLTGERRSSQSTLSGRPFSFSPGEEDGETDVTALRVGMAWTERTQQRVIAAQSTFTFGLGTLGATDHGGDLPDGKFLAWLGQIQYVQRLWKTNNRMMLRLNTQLASDNLLPLEQFGIGGMHTVRGYRENEIVRDNGAVASLEIRIPLLRDTATDSDILQLAPFLDIGYAWDTHNPKREELMCSAGPGLLLALDEQVDARLYWGVPFRQFDHGEYNVQDSGIHFSLIVRLF